MDIIRSILGLNEAEEGDNSGAEDKKPKDKKPKAKSEKPGDNASDKDGQEDSEAPLESQIEEIANMWHSGNRDDVVRRFMTMDNETAVKLVFSIGREGSLELARMTDTLLEQMGDQEGVEPPPEEGGLPEDSGEASTEPASYEPPPQEGDGYPAQQIMGKR